MNLPQSKQPGYLRNISFVCVIILLSCNCKWNSTQALVRKKVARLRKEGWWFRSFNNSPGSATTNVSATQLWRLTVIFIHCETPWTSAANSLTIRPSFALHRFQELQTVVASRACGESGWTFFSTNSGVSTLYEKKLAHHTPWKLVEFVVREAESRYLAQSFLMCEETLL